jgi:hypothetical protein
MGVGRLIYLSVRNVLDSERRSNVILRLQAGGRPAATYLFCFAKKGKPKKATALRCPMGARLCKSKNGKRPQLATLRQGRFFFHFLPRTSGSSEAEF